MVIALSTEIGHALTAQEREVPLHPSLHCTLAKHLELLPMLLTIQDCRLEPSRIEAIRNRRQTLQPERSRDGIA